jgi:hypothetical protein
MRGKSYLEARKIQRIKVVDLLKFDYDSALLVLSKA